MNDDGMNIKILEHLQGTDIFADIPVEILRQNIPQLKMLHFDKQKSIIRKDDIGDAMYIIIKGKVKVHDNDFVVATLSDGNYFGEMSLLHTAPRSMSVSSMEEVELICIDQVSFYNILKDQPDLIQKIISHLVIRLRSQNNTLIEELRSRETALKKQVEEQTQLYREQKERAEQSEKFKQQFLANMSHEICTPMNAVMGMTSLLMDKNPRPDQIHYLDGIKKSSDNLLHIINDILDLSKIEAGKMELENIDFSIREIVDQVQQTLQHKADEKKIELKLNIDPALPDILMGDPVRLNQVLINLTGNAIKFTETGSVSIHLKLIDKKLQTNSLAFSVIDKGIGIPEDKLDSVFEGFSQANASDTRKFGGTGLGLTISKQLVAMMGGEITLKSKEASYINDKDHGTTFSFTIAMEDGSVDRLHKRILSEEQIDGSILNGLRILIVDDNEYNRIVATDTLLSKATLYIQTAESAKEAIEALKEKTFDVILMDLQMPEMDGYEATRYIRTRFAPPGNNIPIIALTASVLRHDLDKCLQAGMNSYISKPFKASQLIAGIAAALHIELKPINLAPSLKKTETQQIPEEEKNIPMRPVTNLNYLTTFCEGNMERMKKYIGMFTSSTPAFLEKMENALSTGNYEEIANQVHAARTKLVMMGMEESKELSIQIEKACRDLSLNEKTHPSHSKVA
ncbi:hybrid signal transduction histidine kinase K [Filimonas sp.]|nr:hybrid signal transduction histidine kinase K [Filimonas sp.]